MQTESIGILYIPIGLRKKLDYLGDSADAYVHKRKKDNKGNQ